MTSIPSPLSVGKLRSNVKLSQAKKDLQREPNVVLNGREFSMSKEEEKFERAVNK